MYTTVKATAVVTAAAALLLSGCGTGGGEVAANDAPQGTNRPAETVTVTVTADAPAEEPEEPSVEPTSEEPVDEPTTDAPASSTNPVFGDTYTWADGIAVTIGAPTPFEPSEYALAEGAAAYVSFEVTLVNGSPANYEPATFYTTVQSGNVEAEQVFDGENGLEGSPSTTLLPGREAKFTIGYGVADPADIVMDVSAGFDYDNAIFTS